jgi:formate/nitrite transporter FocA (FNT family)
MQFSVPLYFQVTEGASNTNAGVHLVPVVLGNTIGGLMTGFLIKKLVPHPCMRAITVKPPALAY